MPEVDISRLPLLFFKLTVLRQGLPVNLELTVLTSLTGQGGRDPPASAFPVPGYNQALPGF